MPVIPITGKDDYAMHVEAVQQLCVVGFTATWCQASKRMATELEELDAVYKGTAGFFQVDVDECEDLTRDCGVKVTPTYLFLRNGRLVFGFSGSNRVLLKGKVEELLGPPV